MPYKISELIEKPPKEKAPSNLAIMGRYVLTLDIFDRIDETGPGVGGEIQLPMHFKSSIQYRGHIRGKDL